MPLEKDGLVKLVEECGELIQVAAKKMALDDFQSWDHWDGAGDLKVRMEKEVADVMAACVTVISNFELDEDGIDERITRKIKLFEYWHRGGKETKIPDPIRHNYHIAHCHDYLPKDNWCDRNGPGGFMGHTCLPQGAKYDSVLGYHFMPGRDATTSADGIAQDSKTQTST